MTADAGQAFEVIPTELVRGALEELRERCKDMNLPPFVAVSRSGHVECFFVPTVATIDGYAIYSIDLIIDCSVHVLAMRVYRLGDLFVLQKEGVPIGGPLSSAFVELVLGRVGDVFHRRGWRHWIAIDG